MKRRDFLAMSAAAQGDAVKAVDVTSPMKCSPVANQWRGFNFGAWALSVPPGSPGIWRFKAAAELGMNAVRIPISYQKYSTGFFGEKLNESELDENLDRWIEEANILGLHVVLCLHRVPGYCVNRIDLEPMRLFEGPASDKAKALKAAMFHWGYLARRYRHVPADNMSFNLINEPPRFVSEDSRKWYKTVVSELVGCINDAGGRQLVLDGTDGGEQIEIYSQISNQKTIVQSTRGYWPGVFTHYKAPFVSNRDWPDAVEWPMRVNESLNRSEFIDREALEKRYETWIRQGSTVIVGEFGVWKEVGDAVASRYIDDLLSIYTENHWGWFLWDIAGPFGFISSGRTSDGAVSGKWGPTDRHIFNVVRRHLKPDG